MAIYMKYGTIEGSVTDENHPKWIELNNCTLGAMRPLTMSVGGAAERKHSNVSLQEVSATKGLDVSSILLLQECLKGGGQLVNIHFCHGGVGAAAESYLEVTLKETMLSMFGCSGDSNNPPFEQLSLSFTDIEVKHIPTDKTGSGVGPKTAGYNLETGVAR